MRLLFVSLVGLLAAIAAGILFSRDTGRVLITLGEWTVQTTVSFFVVALVLLFAVLYLLVRSVIQLVRLPRDWGRWSNQRRYRRSEQHLLDGLVAMLEDDWRAAERALHKGALSSRQPVLNLLGAARSAQRQGALTRRDHYLKLAQKESDGTSPDVDLARAGLQLEGPGSDQAYATLKAIEAQHPQDGRVQLTLLDAAVHRADWEEAARLLESAHVAKLLPEEGLHRRRLDVHDGLLRRAAGRERLEEAWRRISTKLQREPRLIAAYVEGRLRHADTADCEPLLRRALEREWEAALVRLYGKVRGADPARQLRAAESWLGSHPGDADLLLALGRLCRHGELWGKARQYLEESTAARAGAEAFLELGTLHEQRGDAAAALDCYRRGLELPAGR